MADELQYKVVREDGSMQEVVAWAAHIDVAAVSRRKGELSPAGIDRGWPYHVALIRLEARNESRGDRVNLAALAGRIESLQLLYQALTPDALGDDIDLGH